MTRLAGRLATLATVVALAACGAGESAAAPSAPGVAAPNTAPSTTPSRTPRPTPSAAATKPGPTSHADLTPVVEKGPGGRRVIALTFDADLTSLMRRRLETGEVKSYYNAALIETLRKQKVHATLFLTGLWMQQYPDVVRDLAKDPLFELGTHSMTHRAFTSDCFGLGSVPRNRMLAEVADAVEVLDGLDPDATRWFRFPGGCYDRDALRRTGPAGVTAIGIDVYSGDGGADSAQSIVDTVLRQARPGAIVTLHMHGGNLVRYTGAAIKKLVPALRARGYELVTVTELLARRKP